jgi:hydroxymethylglutaryl-CoA reductase
MSYGKEKGSASQSVLMVSEVVDTGGGQEIVHFDSAMAREPTMQKVSAVKKKNCKDSSCFKSAFKSDIKLWSSRLRRHRRNRSNVEKKEEGCKAQMLITVSKR